MIDRPAEQWATYERVGSLQARPYIPGENLTRVSVSPADRERPSLDGGMIGRNPDNHGDRWYIAPEYFAKHYRANQVSYKCMDCGSFHLRPEPTR